MLKKVCEKLRWDGCMFEKGSLLRSEQKKLGVHGKSVCQRTVEKRIYLKRLSRCFFPREKSSEGNFTDFLVDVTDFKDQAIDDQITAGELYEQTKLPVLRFYLTTKKKIIPSDTQSDTQFHFSSENMQDSWSPTWPIRSVL